MYPERLCFTVLSKQQIIHNFRLRCSFCLARWDNTHSVPPPLSLSLCLSLTHTHIYTTRINWTNALVWYGSKFCVMCAIIILLLYDRMKWYRDITINTDLYGYQIQLNLREERKNIVNHSLSPMDKIHTFTQNHMKYMTSSTRALIWHACIRLIISIGQKQGTSNKIEWREKSPQTRLNWYVYTRMQAQTHNNRTQNVWDVWHLEDALQLG